MTGKRIERILTLIYEQRGLMAVLGIGASIAMMLGLISTERGMNIMFLIFMVLFFAADSEVKRLKYKREYK